MPSIFGRATGSHRPVFFHLLAFVLFTLTGVQMGLNLWYYAGIAVTGAALFLPAPDCQSP